MSEKSGLLEGFSAMVKLVRIFFLVLIPFGLAGWAQSGASGVRAADFKNFSYPWIHPDRWPNHLQWMSLRLKEQVRLTNGKWDERDAAGEADGLQFSGLTLEEIQYAKLTSDHSEDAIVVLRYDSGGTQNHYWVYLYGDANGDPKLLGFFHAGDRAAYGLYGIFVKDRVLNVQLFDPKFQEGDCCSSGYLNYRFRWNGLGFEALGDPIAGRAEARSRRPVSVFGLPVGQQ